MCLASKKLNGHLFDHIDNNLNKSLKQSALDVMAPNTL